MTHDKPEQFQNLQSQTNHFLPLANVLVSISLRKNKKKQQTNQNIPMVLNFNVSIILIQEM